jgi:hypothetical protein
MGDWVKKVWKFKPTNKASCQQPKKPLPRKKLPHVADYPNALSAKNV